MGTDILTLLAITRVELGMISASGTSTAPTPGPQSATRTAATTQQWDQGATSQPANPSRNPPVRLRPTGNRTSNGHAYPNIAGYNPDWIVYDLSRPKTCLVCQPMAPRMCQMHGNYLALYQRHDGVRQRYFDSLWQPARGQPVNLAGRQPEAIFILCSKENSRPG